LKPEGWGSPLVQEKLCQGEKTCGKRRYNNKKIIIIMTTNEDQCPVGCDTVTYEPYGVKTE